MTTQAKVVIPREVADAIEYLRNDEGDGRMYSNEMVALLYADVTISGAAAVTLRKISFDTLMRALLDGYERELTEEEKRAQACQLIRTRYDHHYRGSGGYSTSEEDEAFAEGIEFTLDALRIAIPGVNAPEETTHKEEPAHV